MRWGDLQLGDVIHNNEKPWSTSWLLLECGGVAFDGMIDFKWLSLNDGSVVNTRNLKNGELKDYKIEQR